MRNAVFSPCDLPPLQGWFLGDGPLPRARHDGGHLHEYMRCPPFVSAPWAVVCRPVGAHAAGCAPRGTAAAVRGCPKSSGGPLNATHSTTPSRNSQTDKNSLNDIGGRNDNFVVPRPTNAGSARSISSRNRLGASTISISAKTRPGACGSV